MKCTICGKINPNDARFCSDCAAPLNAGQDMENETLENAYAHEEEQSSGARADSNDVQGTVSSMNDSVPPWGHRNQFPNQVWPPTPNPSATASSAGTQGGSGTSVGAGNGYGAFIPEVRKRTVQEHVRNISVTLIVIAAILAVGFFGVQMFQSGGEQMIRDYMSAANAGDYDKMMELSIPEDFYEFTEQEFGAGKEDYRKLLSDFSEESLAASRIQRLVKELPSPGLLDKVRDYYENDWGIDRKDVQEVEVYEIELVSSEPGYEPMTETVIFPILKYRGKWYVYTWTFEAHTYVRNEMIRMKERSNK